MGQLDRSQVKHISQSGRLETGRAKIHQEEKTFKIKQEEPTGLKTTTQHTDVALNLLHELTNNKQTACAQFK